MAAAQLRYQGPADAGHTQAPAFLIGSRAYVKAQFFRTTRPSKKLADKFLRALRGSSCSRATTWSPFWLPDSLHAVPPSIPCIYAGNPRPLMRSPTGSNLPCLPSMWTMSQRFEIAEVLDSKVDNHHHKCKLL